MTTNTNYQIHAAYNLATGELFMTTRSCDLCNRIRRDKAWKNAQGLSTPSEWVFAHGDNACERLAKKVARILTEREAHN